MEPIYKSLALTAMTLQVSLALNAQVYDGEDTSETSIPAEVLDSLRVELISQNVSGARDLIKSGECTVDGSDLSITLNAANWIKGATYRVQVVATFGTQTQVIYALDITVPYYEALSDTPQEYEDTVTVVSTIGDGDKSGADANVYAKDGDGNAHITTPLSICNADAGASIQADGNGAIASGYAEGDGASIQAGGDGAIASGYAEGDGASIQATNAGAIASGNAYGTGASIQATNTGAIASGYADAGASIQATGDGAIASGNAYGTGASIQADGNGAIASGYAYGTGASIQAGGDGAIASGYADAGASIQADGNGAIASGYADAGASIQADGNGAIASGNAYGTGASIQADGNGAIASGYADGTGASIQATGDGAIASGNADTGASIQADGNGAVARGYADVTKGNIEASGKASQALGIGVKATQDAQMVVGKCNVVDEDGDYAFIIGNGTADNARSNAFAIDWNGNLVLFNAGTPVVLTPAKLAALIA